MDLVVCAALVGAAAVTVPPSILFGAKKPKTSATTTAKRAYLARKTRKYPMLKPIGSHPVTCLKNVHQFAVTKGGQSLFRCQVPYLRQCESNGYMSYASSKNGEVYKFEKNKLVDSYRGRQEKAIAIYANRDLSLVYVHFSHSVVEATNNWRVLAAFDRPVDVSFGRDENDDEVLVISDRGVHSIFLGKEELH